MTKSGSLNAFGLLLALCALLALVGCSDDKKGVADVQTELPGYDTEVVDQTDTDGADTVGDGPDVPVDAADGDVADAVDVDPDLSNLMPIVRSCEVEIVYDGTLGTPGISVFAAGDFNGFDETTTPLTNTGGTWSTAVILPPGDYAYKFVVDGLWEGDPPPSVYAHWDGGFENRNLRVPDCQTPEWRVERIVLDSNGVLEGRVRFARASGSEAPLDPASVQITVAGQSLAPTIIDAESGLVEFSQTVTELGKYSVRINGADTEGVAAENNPLYTPVWYEPQTFDWRDASLYLIFTDRFRDTDGVDQRIPGVEERANYLGGDFAGITAAIEEGYLDQMGINAIWLSPIYDNPEIGYRDKRDDTKLMSGFHGYWPISLDPEPRYGDAQMPARDRLKELVDTAHAHGIRVLFDLALNHVHESHPYCQNSGWCDMTCQCGSPGCGWDPSERGLDCQFDYFLPDLSYRNHDIVNQVVRDTMEMLDEYDIDGLRIDAARHMDHVIMRTLSLTLRDTIEARGGAEYYLVGETFTDDRGQIMQYVSEYELDGQFDFAMRSAIRGSLAYSTGSFRNLDAAAAASESSGGYGDFVWSMSPFFGNHDIKRTATIIAGNDQGPWGNTPDLMAAGDATTVDQWNIINRMSMAYAFLLAYKGVPLLYYGDEIGLAGGDDPDNRRMMMWTLNANQQELLGRVQVLGQARRDLVALRRGERRELWVDDDLYVFARYIPGQPGVIVALNKGGNRTETITVPAELGFEGLTLNAVNSTRAVTVSNDAITLQLDSWEYAIFAP